MNETNCNKSCCNSWLTAAAWLVGAVGTFAVIGALAIYSTKKDPAPGLDRQREAVRYQARKDLDAVTTAEVNKFAVDGAMANKAQLSVNRAMEVMLTEWKDDTAAGRAKLLERLEASKKTASFE